MSSPFVTHLLWAAAQQRGRALFNRLTALTVNVEILAEDAARERGSAGFHAAVEAIRVELADAARDTRHLVETISSQLPATLGADLATAVRDTIAPLRRHLERRETRLVVAEIPHGISVALEPELLRAAIAATLDAILSGALPSEVIRLDYTRGAKHDALTFTLETRAGSGAAPSVDAALAPLCAWLEIRGGRASLRHEGDGLSVALQLPSREEPTC